MASKFWYKIQMLHNTTDEPLEVTLWAATDQDACRKAEEDNPDYRWVSCEETGMHFGDPAEPTTEEIIKAMRICGDTSVKCTGCPLFERGITCGEDLLLMAADLLEKLTKNAE